jgi:hypothetical protein
VPYSFDYLIILLSSIAFKISCTTFLSCHSIAQEFVISTFSSPFQANNIISHSFAQIRAVLIASFLSGITQKFSPSFLSIHGITSFIISIVSSE